MGPNADNLSSHRSTRAGFATFAALLLTILFLTSCSRSTEHRASFMVFGTVLEVQTWGAREEQASRAFSDLEQMFRTMHRDWHAWEPGMLTEINQAFARGETAVASDQIVEMIRRSQKIEALSAGKFNPAVGGLIELWGFHTSDFPIVGPPPDPGAIRSLMEQSPSSLDIVIDGNRLYSENRAVQLDFGGIAKGFAIDLACDRLRSHGIEHAVVNAGGDLRAFGRKGDRSWRLGIRNPSGGVVGGLSVQGDEAVFTSGVYERFREDRQTRYPHILNPATGWPVDGLTAVTVIADEGLLADAAATALIVAGSEQWPLIARSLGLDEVLVIDRSGVVYLTPAMNDRVQLSEGVEARVVDPTSP